MRTRSRGPAGPPPPLATRVPPPAPSAASTFPTPDRPQASPTFPVGRRRPRYRRQRSRPVQRLLPLHHLHHAQPRVLLRLHRRLRRNSYARHPRYSPRTRNPLALRPRPRGAAVSPEIALPPFLDRC